MVEQPKKVSDFIRNLLSPNTTEAFWMWVMVFSRGNKVISTLTTERPIFINLSDGVI